MACKFLTRECSKNRYRSRKYDNKFINLRYVDRFTIYHKYLDNCI